MARAAIPGRLAGRLSWRPARLEQVRDETASARTLLLRVADWPGHLAGQHVDVRLTAPDGYSTQRSYSLAAPADGGLIALTVQRVPDGEVSPYLVDVLTPGQQVELRGPVGGWFVWHPADAPPVLLVGGGSGVVPLMAMIRARRAVESRAPFRLLYSVRTPDEVYYADELATPIEGVEVTLAFTRRAPADWPHPPHRVTASDLETFGWPATAAPRCFVCGPTGFVEAVADMLVAAGHATDQIRTERFGSSEG